METTDYTSAAIAGVIAATLSAGYTGALSDNGGDTVAPLLVGAGAAVAWAAGHNQGSQDNSTTPDN